MVFVVDGPDKQMSVLVDGELGLCDYIFKVTDKEHYLRGRSCTLFLSSVALVIRGRSTCD